MTRETFRPITTFTLGSLALLTFAVAPTSIAYADSVKGSISRTGSLTKRHSYVFRYAFKAGQTAHVSVNAAKLSTVTVQIYDPHNHLITQKKLLQNPFFDTDSGVSWRPKQTETFTIKVTTPDDTPVSIVLKTN